ncbi:MAG: hypothetical protein HFH71_06200, partial [Clostridia bacterium]|nr:hypothetical protein [Clostridia bacterium]
MSRRYRLITGMSAAVVIVAILICLCFVSFNNINDVFAFNTSNITSGAVDVGDILLEGYADRTDGKVFNKDIMSELYTKLTGDKSKSGISDVDALGTLTAADIRAKNEGKDIVLTMDGQQWTVTHLTKDSSGKTIVTLWRASESTMCEWNLWAEDVTTYAYPSSMYSTSFVRADALNSGGNGYVATKGAETLTEIEQNARHKYARLTMPNVKGSLTDFIVKPSAVAYQGTENNMAGGAIGNVGWTLPNEAYGTPSGTENWYVGEGKNMDYSGKSGYADWKDDYIWLPSLTETGRDETTNGIWALSDNQRSNSANSWLRSGIARADYACYLAAAGGSISYSFVTNSYAVRPALHLNLNLAAQHSGKPAVKEPTDVSVDYKGTTLTLDDVAAEQKAWFDSNKISITYDSDIKDAGVYKVKAEINADLAADGLTFEGEPDTSAGESDTVRYFNFTVTKKKIGI